MSYRILPTKEFAKDFARLAPSAQEQVRAKLAEAAQNPARYKKLHYALKGSSRVRVGKLRIIFSYDVGKGEMYLEKIVFGHEYER
jgi:mRNA-degrading endonuclease RelE of RelBE toxin-antitoxin system